jgi:effector-binding domain-containing protein
MSVTAPPDLVSIGAFARRSRLSLKALRLYDELGLLTPARVDPETGYRSGEPMYDVATRDVPAQDVISITRSLTVKDLERFIVDGTRDLLGQVERAGARPGHASFVIYHGEVNDDSDGPVEVCVPFTGSVPAQGEASVRAEPAHREAYTTITMAQCQFPGILDAYAAVERWIETNGAQMSAAPREVYFNDDPEPEPDRPFCDIAFPIGGPA